MSAAVTTAPQDSAGFWKTRYTMLLLNTLGLAISYATRVNISVAIVDMVNGTALREREAAEGTQLVRDPDSCPGELVLEGPGGRKEGEFVWDMYMQGEILAGFYYGYTVGHIPGGVLADRFGGKVVLLFGILVSSILTVLTPLSAWAGYYVLFTNRVLQGLAQGGIIPAIQTTVCTWAPDHERSLFSIIFLGICVGTLVSMAVTGILCETIGGWPLSFYFFGGVGLLWCVPWFFQAADSPSQHPSIDPAERNYIKATIQSAAKKKLPVPWKSIMSTPAVWALIAIMITFDWIFYLLITSLPQYIAQVLHFDIRSNGIISAIPHITGGAGNLIFVWFTGFLLRKGRVSKTCTFRIINGLGTLVPAAALVVVALMGCDSTVIIVMLALSGFFIATDCTGSYLNMQAIAPNYAGTIVGIVNMFANLTGIAIPYIVGAFTNTNPTRSAWNAVFYLSSAVAAVSYLIYAVFTTADEQPWNVPPSERAQKATANEGIENTAFDKGVTPMADGDRTQKGRWKANVP
ncbi:sialin-like isoform X1 [Schistocerca piceifrons]|uniref:sialin-like isoform X1 n=1 Tax=Schistocerca piceifrons TaxID=274613 RepID=UPI001F5E8B86|nr:sialin-like isoform X1 [Schistocerca piceifrons]